MGNEKLVQFQCDKEGTLFYYQTGLTPSNYSTVVDRCPVCGSKCINPTGRTYPAIDEATPLEKRQTA